MTDSTPLVSFILPSYNRESILRQVLGELKSRQYRFSFETIVLDNNSSDNSVDMVRREFPEVKLFDLQKNLGAVSRNIGIENAKGEYIVMLDDDSYPLPNAVENAIHVFESDREDQIGCIAFNIRRADGSYETAGILTAFTGCAAMFRSDVFAKVGVYPEDYLFYVEEYDLSCRIWQAGMKVLNFKELEFVHLKTSVNRDFNKNLERLVRNNLLLWSKYLPKELADRQIETELWRYENIGKKENAMAGFHNGVKLGKELRRVQETDHRFKLPESVAEQVLHIPAIKQTCETLKNKGHKRILLFNAGKLLHFVVDAVEGCGMEVVAIVDDNTFMQASGFNNIPIVSRSALLELSYDTILLGTTSLALNDCYEQQLNSLGVGKEVTRLAKYHRLSYYI